MSVIKSITAREILNAKGNPAVESTVVLDSDQSATASAPSGTSLSSHEVVDLKDADSHHFLGNGVLKAVQHVTKIIAPALIGKDPTNQAEIDKVMIELDGTANKSKLGANAILSVSLAVAKAAALSQSTPLYTYIGTLAKNNSFAIPTPIFNLINGGLHAVGPLDFQEFIVTPHTSKTYTQALQIGYTVRKSLENMLQMNNFSTLIGDEGGFSPHLRGNSQALQFLKDAIEEAGYTLGMDVSLSLDAAPTTFWKNNKYVLREKDTPLSSSELLNYYKDLIREFTLFSIEDICAEDDWEGWEEGKGILGKDVLIIGDDLISTNPARLQMAIDKNILSAVIIKPNQIGTVTETLEVVKKAQEANLTLIVSHRSGETNDDFIADFAVGIGAEYCKFGAPVRGERVAKYNRLLQIEKELLG